MPRAEKLSSRLETLIEDIFASPSDPFALYWSIAAQISHNQLAAVQTKIRKTLRQRGEIGAESAVLLACVLHLTGFPAHRLLHFLSLYIPGGIRLSLFELAVSAIFLGEPPIPAHMLYDLTQYTYLEKRLLVRKSLEISDALRGSLGPGVLLYLYLLSLRDDLSNENIQLVALIMKNCFPSQEVRTRLGGASLEEYGEIARAWKGAERRSLDLELSPGGGPGRAARAFDRNSASFFLDKYFSDKALSEMRAAAPSPPKRRPPPRSADPRPARTTNEETAARERKTARSRADQGIPVAQVSTSRAPRKKAAGNGGAAPSDDRAHMVPEKAEPPRRSSSRAVPGDRRRLLLLVPTALAAAVMALLLLWTPPFGTGSAAAAPAAVPVPSPAAAPNAAAGSVALPPSPVLPAQPAPAASQNTSYVVRPGDSLWKIFTSMRPQAGDRKGWMDFLSKTQSMNGLDDPDRLQPGKVLTLSADH
jgi:hypothetical protein